MSGPFVPVPSEVIELLEEKTTPVCFQAYFLMINCFYVEEKTDTEGIWVAGIVHAKKSNIANRVSKSRGYFNETIWTRWESAGVVAIREGAVYLPMLYKKGEAFLQPLRMRKEIDGLNTKQAEMEQTIQNLVTLLSETAGSHHDSVGLSEAKNVHSEAIFGLSEASPHARVSILSGSRGLKITLSEINKLITMFYRKIGQTRIAKPVRDKAVATFRGLMKEGYKPGEIAYSLYWIPENATEKIQHFGIVPHMIDQAIESGNKELQAEEAKEMLRTERNREKESILTEQQERKALSNYKSSLSKTDRVELHDQAMESLRKIEGLKTDSEFMSEVLVEAMENDIIRKSDVDLTKFGLEVDGESEGKN